MANHSSVTARRETPHETEQPGPTHNRCSKRRAQSVLKTVIDRSDRAILRHASETKIRGWLK